MLIAAYRVRIQLLTLVAASVLPIGSTCLADASSTKNIVETAVAAGNFKTLVAAVQAADLAAALQSPGPLTVLAPTDEAFAKLPPGTVETLLKPENKQQLIDILKYHVIPGAAPAKTVVTLSGAKTLNGQRIDIAADDQGVRIDGANVSATDIHCSNGIIHVIDSVILPESKNIPEIATDAGTFSTLLAAAQAAGLVDALSGEGPLTVFAPTDDAFGALPAGTIESLLKPESRDKLANILKYHVVAGRVYSDDALAAKSAPTLAGDKVTIIPTEGGARVNDAVLLKTDIDASNGVIHVVDRVLLPTQKPVAAISPRSMIEQAIAVGAPLYNAGHHGQCAQIYMDTLEQIVSNGSHGMSSNAVRMIERSLMNARSDRHMSSRAWTLRHAMDSAYASASR